MHAKQHSHAILKSLAKKLAIPVIVMIFVLVAIFIPTGTPEPEEFVTGTLPITQQHQSAAATVYMTNITTRQIDDGSATTPDLDDPYVDAAGVVAEYSSNLVKEEDGAVIGYNSPTRALTDAAYVVNTTTLITAEMQDLIDFEQSYLGLSGHDSAIEYMKQDLQVPLTVTPNHGESSRSYFYGAVGPAVTIRDYYKDARYNGKPCNGSEFYACFGSEDRVVDLLLVPTASVDTYLEGGDVPVTYVQYQVKDAKQHAAPWGLAQTYLQQNEAYFNADGTNRVYPSMQLQATAGGNPSRSQYAADITGNAVSDLSNLFDGVPSGSEQYWFPMLQASASDYPTLDFASDTQAYRATSSTHSIVEAYDTPAYWYVRRNFEDYTMVGILVYAVQ